MAIIDSVLLTGGYAQWLRDREATVGSKILTVASSSSVRLEWARLRWPKRASNEHRVTDVAIVSLRPEAGDLPKARSKSQYNQRPTTPPPSFTASGCSHALQSV